MSATSPSKPFEDPFGSGPATPLTTGSGTGSEVTLVAGASFCVCSVDGQIAPVGVQGYYAFDTRLLSHTALYVDGEPPRFVETTVESSRRLVAVGVCGDPTTAGLLLIRTLTLGSDLVERIELWNLRNEPVSVSVESFFGTDFADVFEVKRGDVIRRGFAGSGAREGALTLTLDLDNSSRTVHISSRNPYGTPFEIRRDSLQHQVELGPREEWSTEICVQAEVVECGHPRRPLVLGMPNLGGWLQSMPGFQASRPALQRTWDRSVEDLGALRLWDHRRPDRPAIAAGVPWYMTLFGRDSILAGMAALPIAPDLLLGSLDALARRQGRRSDARTLEGPGKILHELRSGEVVRDPHGWGEVYFGSVDATPLFVMALAEAWRWGADRNEIAALLPAAEAAMSWTAADGDLDADGLVEYRPQAGGLVNQGWKDSFDGIRHEDGTLAEGDIALVEVQGYVHRALHDLAALRRAFGNGNPSALEARADRLAGLIDNRYWQHDLGFHAVALDGSKSPVRSITTNPAHLLWTGTVTQDRAKAVADRLLENDCFTGFGLRTLSTDNSGYNPMSYHCGSVWPHDTAIAIAGMGRYNLDGAMWTLITALLDAAQAFGGRLPELFGGFDRMQFPRPIPYPTSCSPQAWAAASPILLVRAMLGLEVDIPAGTVTLRPRLPDGLCIEIDNLCLGSAGQLSLYATESDIDIRRAPDSVTIDIT